MTKEELEKEAEAFVSEKADKGNFDVEKFGKAYFSESSMKQALVKFAEPREKLMEMREKETQILFSRLADRGRRIQIFEQKIEQLREENAKLKKELKDANEKVVHLACNQNKDLKYKLTKAKEIILKLYNAGRDVLMCRAEEKAYDNLDNAINDRSIEQFLEDIEKC